MHNQKTMESRPKQRAVGCMCVHAWVCICILFSSIWVSFVIPCFHTHTLLVFFCFVVFLFVWTVCTLAEAKTSVVVVLVLLSHIAFSASFPLTDFKYTTYCHLFFLMAGWSFHFK